MVSAKTKQIVKSTAPILAEHGETLTRHFYKRMFEHNPEVQEFFNPSNQAKGAQQRALAGAICAYATHIDNLEVLTDAVELIAHKHASLQVKPEHYPIVGENLLASIKEVLGEGATPEIIDAWAEAYGFLADIFIKREEELYQQQKQALGGWNGFRQFRVERKQPESDVITSFYLKPTDGKRLPSFKAGQYITVRMPTPYGYTTMRNYSLSGQEEGMYRISVKRESGNPDGFVSTNLHAHIQEGDTLEVGPPCGNFVFHSPAEATRPIVFLAGGVGITPLLPQLREALAVSKEREVYFFHATMSPQLQAFKHELEALAQAHKNLKVNYRYSAPTDKDRTTLPAEQIGLIDTPYLKGMLPATNADFYFCGPEPFMASIYKTLQQWQVPQDQIQFEFFGPQQALTA